MKRIIIGIVCALLCAQGLILSLQSPIDEMSQHNDLDAAIDVFSNSQSNTTYSVLDTTFIGAEYNVEAIDFTLHQDRFAYISGRTTQDCMPIKNAHQETPNGSYEMYLAKIDVVTHELLWGTYFGGSSVDFVTSIDVDNAGNLYVLGWTESSNFPVQSAVQDTYGGTRDASVSKFTSDGELVFSTYFGGIMSEETGDIESSDSGDVYFTGTTYSEDFPTTAGLDSTLGGEQDAFMVKLTDDGSLIWSTLLGSDADERGESIAIDNDDLPYLCGYTGWTSTDSFPLINPIDDVIESIEGFVVRYNETGHLNFSTYIGGNSRDRPKEIIVTDNDEIFLTGETDSTDFPTVSAFQVSFEGGRDTFIIRFNQSAIIYSSYFGGPGYEWGASIALDAVGNCYISSGTQGNISILVDPFDSSWDIHEGVIAKINSSGGMVYGSYLGGDDTDTLVSIATDQDGDCYAFGSTSSLDFPVENENSAKTNSIQDLYLTRIGCDTTVPTINSPEDLEHFDDESENQIVWSPYDKNPNFYNITRNGVLHSMGWWNTSEDTIIVNTDNLEPGTYNFEITVVDTVLHTASDIVVVNVNSVPNLELSNPPDFNYAVGSSGNTITWVLLSGAPISFTILRNDAVVIQSEWVLDEIVFNVDYLLEGVFNFTLIIRRGSNSASDSVIVRVLTTSTFDLNSVLTIGIISSAAVIAVVLIAKRR